MSYLRFSPREYQAVAAACGKANLNRCRPRAFKRFLVESLAGDHPGLAERINRLGRQEIGLLHEHLCGSRRPAGHDLGAEEVEMLAEAAGPLLCKVRFRRALKRALVRHFREKQPGLAAKLGRLSDAGFEALCEQFESRGSP